MENRYSVYRVLADQAFARAQRTDLAAFRETYLRVAARWSTLADRLEAAEGAQLAVPSGAVQRKFG